MIQLRLIHLRLILPLTLAALTVTATAPAGPARDTGSSRFVHRGELATIALTTDSQAVCLATVHYTNGQSQSGDTKYARDGRLAWTFRVPSGAGIGTATWSVRCGVTWSQDGSFTVLPARSTVPSGGRVPHVVVDDRGFSQRAAGTGAGSAISYGLMLRNTATNEDALDVYVLVNFVGADGRLIASRTQSIGLVGAGQRYALGDSTSLPGQTAVARLEVAAQVRAHHSKQSHPAPAVANLRIVTSTSDPSWVGGVDGELVNRSARLVLGPARLSIVLRDAAGRIVGGGTGKTPGALPPGARMVFGARSGFSAVPLDKAVSPVVSVQATYR